MMAQGTLPFFQWRLYEEGRALADLLWRLLLFAGIWVLVIVVIIGVGSLYRWYRDRDRE